MNKYQELRNRQQQEFNTLPLGFALDQKQFDEMMRGWGLHPKRDVKKICSIGACGYIQKKDVALLHQTNRRHRQSWLRPLRRIRPERASSSRCFTMS